MSQRHAADQPTHRKRRQLCFAFNARITNSSRKEAAVVSRPGACAELMRAARSYLKHRNQAQARRLVAV